MDKPLENYLAPTPQRSPLPRPATSSASSRLTPSEIEQLQQDKKTALEEVIEAENQEDHSSSTTPATKN